MRNRVKQIGGRLKKLSRRFASALTKTWQAKQAEDNTADLRRASNHYG